MSMKRAKEVRRGPKDTGKDDDGFFPKDPARVWEWEKDANGQPDDAFAKYSPTARYAKGALMMHPKFGKGVVTESEQAKVDVLFQDGVKKLAHGLS